MNKQQSTITKDNFKHFILKWHQNVRMSILHLDEILFECGNQTGFHDSSMTHQFTKQQIELIHALDELAWGLIENTATWPEQWATVPDSTYSDQYRQANKLQER